MTCQAYKYSMRINELQLSTDLRDERYSPTLILKKYGWNIRGSGMFGTVADHPTKPYVIKLFQDDPSYEQFIKFVTTHPNNPHLPKISKNIKKLPGKNNYSYVALEKLNPVTDAILDTKYFPEICYIVVMGRRAGIDINDSSEEAVQDILKKMGFNITDSFKNINLDEVWRKTKRSPDPLWIDIATKLIAATKAYLDLHSGNFMLRGKTLVIIDPWAD